MVRHLASGSFAAGTHAVEWDRAKRRRRAMQQPAPTSTAWRRSAERSREAGFPGLTVAPSESERVVGCVLGDDHDSLGGTHPAGLHSRAVEELLHLLGQSFCAFASARFRRYSLISIVCRDVHIAQPSFDTDS